VCARFRRLLGSSLSRQSSSSSSDPGSESLSAGGAGLAVAGDRLLPLLAGPRRRFRVGSRAEREAEDDSEGLVVVAGEAAGRGRFTCRDEEEGMGDARGVPWVLVLLPLPLPSLFFSGVGSTACLTLRTSVLTLNLDFWLNMLILLSSPPAARRADNEIK
jgi:hypothetical protein